MSSCLKKLPEPKSPKPYPLFIPHSTSFSSSHPSSFHLHICLQPLLHHQPCIPPPHPISKIHWHPHPCLMLHLCPSQPAAPCRVKWTVPVSGESRALRSAQRSSAQLGCQRYKLTMWLLSERDSSTQEVCTDGYYMSLGTASHGGWDEGAKER